MLEGGVLWSPAMQAKLAELRRQKEVWMNERQREKDRSEIVHEIAEERRGRWRKR
jgi:hypothetical protein